MPATETTDLIWENADQRLVISPTSGGRLLSWRRAGVGELVRPADVLDGGAARVLLAEERYPGSSYTTPHLVVDRSQDAEGFRIHLRYFWNTPNAVARRLGWRHKLNFCDLDNLVLDKIIRFDAAKSCLLVDLAITNLSQESRPLTPWLHNSFKGWVWGEFVVINGQPLPYIWHEIYWDSHRAPAAQPGQPTPTMRLVEHSKEDAPPCSMVLGAATTWLAGMASYTQPHFGPGVLEGALELRGKIITLPPGKRWRANCFLGLSTEPDGWKRWATESPEPLVDVVEDASADDGERWNAQSVVPLLQHWALPEEAERGLMVLSPLDKLPFTASSRYAAVNAFSDFLPRRSKGLAEASVWLYATRDLDAISATLHGPAGWKLGKLPMRLKAGKLAKLILQGPPDLAGKEAVEVRLAAGGGELVTLRVHGEAQPTRAFPYQLKQPPIYLRERWAKERGNFAGESAEDFRQWQTAQRKRTLAWVRASVAGPAPLSPRVMEHQRGPHCVREKVVIQSEPGMWMPMYVIRPRRVPAGTKMPAIIFGCGSGPGKMQMAPDETADVQHPSRQNEWPSLYVLSHQLGCIVVCPDHRGQGEWAEANHGQQPGRAWDAGYNIIAQDIWDHLRVVDYVHALADADASRIICMGGSGGGNATRVMTSLDPRVAGGVISSAALYLPHLPEHYFERMPQGGPVNIHPPASFAISTCAMTSLIAPRPLWVLDGASDRGVLPTLPHTPEVAKQTFERWHKETDAARAEIGRGYRILGAGKNYRADWYEGDHLAGFTFNNINPWMKEHWGITTG